MSKHAVGHIAELLRSMGVTTTEFYVPYEYDADEFVINIMDEMLSVEYTSEEQIVHSKMYIDIHSPSDNDREALYTLVQQVNGLLMDLLNEPYDGGVIRQTDQLSGGYRGVTADKNIVYRITCVLQDETKLP